MREQSRKGMHEKLHIMKELNSEKESKQGIAMVTQGQLEEGCVGGAGGCLREPGPRHGHALTHNACTSCSVGTQTSASLCLGNHCCFLSHHLCDGGHWNLGQKHVHSPGHKE